MHRPHYVFHAAAYKHVTMAERCIVPAVRTNVLGAVFTAKAAREVGARFVLISSDKAAEPRSVMGATKRMAELLVLGAPSGPGSIAVRFGNVLGSSGSVVEVMMDAARSGKRLTVTDPDATRFFMTAAEAASLVLKAAVSGESGEVFWLDMGGRCGSAIWSIALLAVATPPGAPAIADRDHRSAARREACTRSSPARGSRCTRPPTPRSGARDKRRSTARSRCC